MVCPYLEKKIIFYHTKKPCHVCLLRKSNQPAYQYKKTEQQNEEEHTFLYKEAAWMPSKLHLGNFALPRDPFMPYQYK